MKIRQAAGRFLELFFPAQCHSCEAPLATAPVPFFCGPCWLGIQPLQGPFCPRCGKPFSSPWALSFSPGHLCGDCRATPPFYDRMITPYPFTGVLAEAIFLFKYRKKTALSRPFFTLASSHLESLQGIDLVLPVPLHGLRLKEREFNQSLLLAEAIGANLRKPVPADLLKKDKITDSQMKLSRSARQKNIKNTFSLTGLPEVLDKTVLLVDDVFTTGATLNECARVLKRGGCKKVIGFALARTLLRPVEQDQIKKARNHSMEGP